MSLEQRLYVIVLILGGVTMAISNLVYLLIYILVGGLIVYAAVWLLGLLALPQPVKNIIAVIIAIIVLLWLLGTLGIVPRMW